MKQNAISLLCVASLLLGLCYAALVRPGTPADEPSHFATVQFYAQHARMPVIGQPGVSYEAQMGPVYYTLAAVIYRVASAGGEENGFYALRLAGLLLLVPQALLVYRIARRVSPRNPALALCAGAFVALNPTLLAMAASVQNDVLAIVLSLWALHLCGAWIEEQAERLTLRHAALLGLLVGAAILTKATATFLMLPIPLFAWRMQGKRALPFIAIFWATALLVCGWWFARNVVLYGDLTAQSALTRYGFDNSPPPVDWHRPSVLAQWLWMIVAYYWLPTAYYRDLFGTPVWLRGFLLTATLLSLAGWAQWLGRANKKAGSALRALPAYGWFLGVAYASCMGIYIVTCLKVTGFAPRVTFPTFVVYALALWWGVLAIARASSERAQQAVFLILLLAMLGANVYTLRAAHAIPVYPYHLFVRG